LTRILITGAGSFIGTNFIRCSSFSDIEEVCVRSISVDEIDFQGVDVVFHLAAIVHQSKRINSRVYHQVNMELPVKIAAKAKKEGVKQFVFMSTVKVYGNYSPETGPWTEDSECFPVDSYGQSKFEAELELKKLKSDDFAVAIVRTPIVYGNGVVANMLKLISMVRSLPMLPFAGISNNRHFTYIDNLVGFLDRIIEIRASGTFIAMDNHGISTTTLIKLLSDSLHTRPYLFKLPGFLVRLGVKLLPRYFDRIFGSFFLDNTKTREILSYSPEVSTGEGVMRMVNYYLASRV
jgi:nucleoside-diphosphate-sugar epimerase